MRIRIETITNGYLLILTTSGPAALVREQTETTFYPSVEELLAAIEELAKDAESKR